MQDLLEKISAVAARADGIEQKLADPAVASNPAEYGALAKELASLRPAAEAASAYRKVLSEIDDADFSGSPVEGYRTLKGLITQAYFATEAGSDERNWDPVPGRWEPCIDRS